MKYREKLKAKKRRMDWLMVTFSADRGNTNTRSSDKNHMHIRPESPAEVFVKHSITKT